jgi:hypothetical protein
MFEEASRVIKWIRTVRACSQPTVKKNDTNVFSGCCAGRAVISID